MTIATVPTVTVLSSSESRVSWPRKEKRRWMELVRTDHDDQLGSISVQHRGIPFKTSFASNRFTQFTLGSTTTAVTGTLTSHLDGVIISKKHAILHCNEPSQKRKQGQYICTY
jgi:hypothetical protein